MLDSAKRYFICSLPYQISIKEGLLQREQIEDEMSEQDFDEIKFSMEMQSLFYGDTDGSFFSFDDISSRRKLKNPMYPPSVINNKTYKIPDLKPDERRILSVDVALMASKKHNNDASSIIINDDRACVVVMLLRGHKSNVNRQYSALIRFQIRYLVCLVVNHRWWIHWVLKLPPARYVIEREE